jgi:hypothetical protein
MDATAIINVQYETKSKSAREGECHKTWADGVVSTDSGFGIGTLKQIKPWEGVTWVEGTAEADEEMRDADDNVSEQSDAEEMDVDEFSFSRARSNAAARAMEACDVDIDMGESLEEEGCSGRVEEDSVADMYGAFAEIGRIDWDMRTRYDVETKNYKYMLIGLDPNRVH